MEPLFMYLVKMFVCSALLFTYYRFALYNTNFHQWNRFYLLASLALSLVVPFINIPLINSESRDAVSVAISSLPWNETQRELLKQGTVTWQDITIYCMAVISVILLLRIVAGIMQVFINYKRNPSYKLSENTRLIVTQLKHAPFSFFNWLFWREDIDPLSENGNRILTHELTHIKEYHTLDKLSTELILCIFWINPFFWLIRRELNMIHEFLADKKAIGEHDGAAFANMILQAINIQPLQTNGIINPLFSSQIKRRLRMITTSKEPRYSYLRRLSGLGIMIFATGTLALTVQKAEGQKTKEQATKKQSAGNSNASDAVVNEIKGKTMRPSPGDKVKVTISDSKKGSGILVDLNSNMDSLAENKASLKNDGPKPLYILDGEVISEQEMQALNTETIEKIDVLKGDKAVEQFGEKGKNGVVIISTKKTINGEVGKEKVSKTSSGSFNVNVVGKPFEAIGEKNKKSPKNEPKPIIFIDGKEVLEKDVENIKPNEIEKIDVFKGEKAIEKYGEKGKNGIVEITMKKPVS